MASEQDLQPLLTSQSPRVSRLSALGLCLVAPVLGGFALGVGYGNIGGVISSPGFSQYYSNPSQEQQQFLAAMMQAGCVVGSMLAGYLCDAVGRQKTAVIACFVLIIGCGITSIPLLSTTTSLAPLILGRTAIGIGGGVLCTCIPMYASELTSPAYRGGVESSFQLFITLGILSAYILNWLLIPNLSNGWQVCLAWQTLPSVLLLCGVLLLPESPRWLILKSKDSPGATRVLCRARTAEEDVEKEVALMLADCNKDEGSWADVFSPKQRHISIVALLVLALQVATGIDMVTVYAPTMFAPNGSSNDQLFYTIFVGLTFVVWTPVAVRYVDRWGRKTLLLVGSAGMATSLFSLSVYYWVVPGAVNSTGIVCIVCVLAYVSCFSFSWGPIGWVVPSELVHSSIRSKVVALGTVLNWISDYAVVSSYLSLTSALGIGGSFMVYGVINVCAFVFVLFLVPETAGYNLEH